jgi:glycosyltransferase involved in cell wall biosynthesis
MKVNKKKICVIGPYPPIKGGISQYDKFLTSELNNHADVTVFSYKRQYPQFLLKGREQVDANHSTGDCRISNIDFSLDSINPFSWISALIKIKKSKPDLVILPWWVVYWVPMYVVFLSVFRVLNIKTLLLCHNIYEHEDHYIKRAVTRMVFKLANFYLVHSTSERSKLLPLIGSKNLIQHLHPLYEFSATKDKKTISRVQDGRVNLLFFGFVREYKGLDLLLEAMHILNDDDLQLTIVGEFWSGKNEFHDYIEQKNIANVSIVDRYVADNEMEDYFLDADVVVLPYRSATGSGVIATAYGYHKPVLVTNVGGLVDAVENKRTGLIVEPDVESLASGITWFKHHKNYDFSLEITKFTDNHMSWNGLCAKIVQLL